MRKQLYESSSTIGADPVAKDEVERGCPGSSADDFFSSTLMAELLTSCFLCLALHKCDTSKIHV